MSDELAQDVAWYIARNEHLKARVETAEAKAARLKRCLGFFASVIKSGEPWTETCEREYRAALGDE